MGALALAPEGGMGGAGGASWGEWLSLTAETLGQRWLTRGCPPLREIAPGGADLSGHTAVVTGPTSGIGTTTAGELMRRGCHGEPPPFRPAPPLFRCTPPPRPPPAPPPSPLTSPLLSWGESANGAY